MTGSKATYKTELSIMVNHGFRLYENNVWRSTRINIRPLLFILYIHDICKSINCPNDPVLFADDTSLVPCSHRLLTH